MELVGLRADAVVVVLDGQDGTAVGVDDTPLAVERDGGTIFIEKRGLVVLTGYHLFTLGVEKSVFAVTDNEDAVACLAHELGVDGLGELTELVVVHGHSIVITSKK